MSKKTITIAILISLIVTLFASWFASSYPDGLEKVAESLSFIDFAKNAEYNFLPDYTIFGKEGMLSTFIAGTIGVIVTFVFVYVISKFLQK